MYVTITSQKLATGFSQSAADFVEYLQKENREFLQERPETFFNQYQSAVPAKEVIREIDGNASKLKKTEPKFYSITVSPGKYELNHIGKDPEALKKYVRSLMKDYAASFNREINGRKVCVDDIKYFAKIEHRRSYKGSDKEVQGNQSIASKILELKTTLRKINNREITGDKKQIKKQIERLESSAPHKLNGKRIVQGMNKAGDQRHVHIIVSRKDVSNSFSLSPGSKYKASKVEMHGKQIKRGFDRDSFFDRAEKTFDTTFKYQRNFVETYRARKFLAKDPKEYYTTLIGLPLAEKTLAFKMMQEAGIPILKIPSAKLQLSLRALKALKKGLNLAVRTSSIGI